MDPVLFLRQATHCQSRALERVEDVRGLRSSAQSRSRSTRGDRAGRRKQEVFKLGMDGMPGLRALNAISSNITRPEKLMNPATAAGSLQGPNPLFAILCAGFACGVLDITAALLVYGHYGRPPMRLLQGIAAGLLGSFS